MKNASLLGSTTPPPSHAASLAVPIHINASTGDATTIVLQWSPPSHATCPGTTAKYLICHMAKGDNVTCEWGPHVPVGQGEGSLQAAAGHPLLVTLCADAEVEAAVSHHTLQNLRPGTAYRVAVQEVTAESRRTCGTWWHFQTKALGNGTSPCGCSPWGTHPCLEMAPMSHVGVLGAELPPPSHARPQVLREQHGNPT